MSRFLFLLFLLYSSYLSHAQKYLVFTNASKNKFIEVKESNFLSVKYKGYLGQNESAKNVVTDITDSTVTLGFGPEFLNSDAISRDSWSGMYKIIRIKDITVFRKMSAGRQLCRAFSTLGIGVGSYFLLGDLYKNSHISSTSAFLISIGAAITLKLMIDALLPEKPKYRMEDGWRITVVQKK